MKILVKRSLLDQDRLTPWQVIFRGQVLASSNTSEAAHEYRDQLHITVVVNPGADNEVLLFESNQSSDSSPNAGWLWRLTGNIIHNITSYSKDEIVMGDIIVVSRTEIQPYGLKEKA